MACALFLFCRLLLFQDRLGLSVASTAKMLALALTLTGVAMLITQLILMIADIYPFADDLDRDFDDRDWFRYFARHGIALDLLCSVLHPRYRQWTAIARVYI